MLVCSAADGITCVGAALVGTGWGCRLHPRTRPSCLAIQATHTKPPHASGLARAQLSSNTSPAPSCAHNMRNGLLTGAQERVNSRR
jgi:hypothetical protein